MKKLLLIAAMLPSTALAQYADLDAQQDTKKKSRQQRDDVIREIEKGTYAKINVGGAVYLGEFSGFVQPGTSLALAVGHDFVDQETTSMAFEFAFFQGVHNGCHFEEQAQSVCSGAEGAPAPFIQGDLRTYSFIGLLEWSTYLSRRVGLGVRAGGGVMFSPLLMDEQYYLDEVVGGTWGGTDPGIHQGQHMMGVGGPTVEYYTKLNHFSVGADIDVSYATNFDLGINATGALKYTF